MCNIYVSMCTVYTIQYTCTVYDAVYDTYVYTCMYMHKYIYVEPLGPAVKQSERVYQSPPLLHLMFSRSCVQDVGGPCAHHAGQLAEPRRSQSHCLRLRGARTCGQRSKRLTKHALQPLVGWPLREEWQSGAHELPPAMPQPLKEGMPPRHDDTRLPTIGENQINDHLWQQEQWHLVAALLRGCSRTEEIGHRGTAAKEPMGGSTRVVWHAEQMTRGEASDAPR